ncbi:hypothetical protein [Dyadobacter sp. LHD-138]|uniref:hypothetical protein n=1 Tax=Dyadobacter sp. LHD-138 TaxID=3071413 RepID=UPI0027E1C96A|nr:hypothetical protein [Dyadobacter sp. LHD-138]MDQ6480540.1 hypothetical protein [Dyadobacter sp. LHD-138]
MGHDLDYQITMLSEYILNHKLDFNNILENSYVIADDLNAKYTVAGLICKIVYAKSGFNGLKRLFLAGCSSEDFYRTIERTFNIRRENFDSFVKAEMKHYSQTLLK